MFLDICLVKHLVYRVLLEQLPCERARRVSACMWEYKMLSNTLARMHNNTRNRILHTHTHTEPRYRSPLWSPMLGVPGGVTAAWEKSALRSKTAQPGPEAEDRVTQQAAADTSPPSALSVTTQSAASPPASAHDNDHYHDHDNKAEQGRSPEAQLGTPRGCDGLVLETSSSSRETSSSPGTGVARVHPGMRVYTSALAPSG